MASNLTIIVGGGIAGLSAAVALQRAGAGWLLVEADNRLGGRVASDPVNGFTLDRGFQVVNSAYSSLFSLVNRNALELRSFLPGARIYGSGRSTTIIDPRRAPAAAIGMSALRSISAGDAVRVSRLLMESGNQGSKVSSSKLEVSAIDELKHRGFSTQVIDNFFKPFFSGVFLEPELLTSWSRLLHQFRYFASGLACLPRRGMGQIALCMASSLPESRIRTGCPVTAVSPGMVQLGDNSQLECNNVILAVDPSTAGHLAGLPDNIPMNAVSCLYYAADTAPFKEPILALPGGSEQGPVTTVAVLTNVQPELSPDSRSLISISVLGCPPLMTLQEQIREQLLSWFGPPVEKWEFLRSYQIEDALPSQLPAKLNLLPAQRTEELRREKTFLCGDYTDIPSIEGAVCSGIRAAEVVLQD